jgi:hypothetical protein
MKSNREVQKDFKQRMRDNGYKNLLIWVSEKDKKLIDKYKKKFNCKSYNDTISSLLQEIDKRFTSNVTSKKSKSQRYDVETNLKTYYLVSELREKDMSLQKIVDYLTEHNIDTLTKTGKWSRKSVSVLIDKTPQYLLDVL